MPNRKKNKTSKRSRPNTRGGRNLNMNPSARNRTIVVRLAVVSRTGQLATGNFVQKYNATHMVANAPEWSSFSALFSEFRILNIRVHLCTEPGSLTGAITVVYGDDRSSSGTPPGNVFGVWQLANAKVWGGAQESRRIPTHTSAAMTPDDWLYRSTLAPSIAYSVVGGVFSTDTTDSSTRIWEYVEYLVEFSGAQ